MAAVTRVRPSLVTPSGEARIRRGLATVDFLRGDAVTIDGSTPPTTFHETAWKKAATTAEAIGVVIKDVKATGTVNVCIDGEVGGFAGLPVGQYLSVAAGDLDDTAPIDGDRSRFFAYSDSVVMVL
jgi:hypothetical protein